MYSRIGFFSLNLIINETLLLFFSLMLYYVMLFYVMMFSIAGGENDTVAGSETESRGTVSVASDKRYFQRLNQ